MKHYPCIDCDKPSEWIRHTQFAGSHYFCDGHARMQQDFNVNDSYTAWEKIENENKQSKSADAN